MTTLTGHPEHEGLGFAERGEIGIGGSVKHWHRYTDQGAERRRMVPGTVVGCNEAYAVGEQPLTDEELLAKIREADDAIDPTPPFLTPQEWEESLEPFSPEEREGIKALQGHHGHVRHGEVQPFLDEEPPPMPPRPDNAPTRFVSTKPQRGGKRTCENHFVSTDNSRHFAECGHSESRHNASGACRTCGCGEFMVKDES